MKNYMPNKYKIDIDRETTKSLLWFLSPFILLAFKFELDTTNMISIALNIIFYSILIITSIKGLINTIKNISKITDQTKRKSIITKISLFIVGFLLLLTLFNFIGFFFVIISIIYSKIFLYDYM